PETSGDFPVSDGLSPRAGQRLVCAASPARKSGREQSPERSLRSALFLRADARTRGMLAVFGAVAAPVLPAGGPVNHRGGELVYDLHWLRRRGSNPRPGG